MAKIVKAQIIEINGVARPMESSSNRFRMIGEHASDPPCENTLLENNLPRVVTSGIEKGDYLMVSVLSSWVFAVADSNRSLRHFDIRPFCSANLGLTHCSRNREADDSSERYKLLGGDDRARLSFPQGRGV